MRQPCNSASRTITHLWSRFLVMWYDTNTCGGDGGNWATKGWWNLSPGQETHTDVWTANRYFYFYAEAEDGAVWNGPYGPWTGLIKHFKDA